MKVKPVRTVSLAHDRADGRRIDSANGMAAAGLVAGLAIALFTAIRRRRA